MEVCTVAPLVCVHVLLLLTAVSEIPFARCGLDLWLAQETPDRPSSDLDSGTKGGGKKGCKEERRCGHREEKDSREVANKILKEGEKEIDGRGVKDMRVKKKKKEEEAGVKRGGGKVRSRMTRKQTDRRTEWGLQGCSVAGGEAPGLVAGPSPCDSQEAGGHRLTRHRHGKRALAQERNTIQGFDKATARLGDGRAKILKQPGLFITHDCQYSHCSPSAST